MLSYSGCVRANGLVRQIITLNAHLQTAPKSRRDESAKETGQSSPLFAASATEYLGVSPAGSMNAVSVVSPSETIADSLEVSNSAHVEDENAQSEPESTTAGAQYDKNSRRSFSSNEATKTPTAKPAKSRRFTRKIKRTKSAADVFDSESEEETQPRAPAALKKKRAAFTQAAETQHRGVGSKEDIRALGKECADLDYVADAWLSSLGEEADFWRAKYYDLMGACLQRPETSCAVAAAQKVSVEQCEIGRLNRKIVRLEQGVGCQNGKYQSDADAVFGFLAEISQNRAEHVRKSEIVAWFLDKYESDCPIELVEARAFRVNLLLNRMVTEGMILYISVMPGSSQPAERGELQYDPEVMMDPHWAMVGLQEHN